jgi:hypothetical protein
MNVATVYAAKYDTVSHLEVKALYELAVREIQKPR